MKTLLSMILAGLLIMVGNQSLADPIADLTEDNLSAGVPFKQQEAPSNVHGLLGLGVFNFRKAVGENDRKTLPLPIIIVAYKDIAYWSLGGGGVWLLKSGDHSAKLGLGIKARTGWEPGDDPLLAGMTDRKTSVDGYMNALLRTDMININATFYHDIGNVSRGSAATLRLSHNFWTNQKIRITPSIGAEWQNAELVDYYYGVRRSEALPDRSFYEGRDTVNASAGLSGLYWMTPDWTLLGGLYVVRFGNGIADSPIVKQDSATIVYLGGAWIF